MAGRDVLQTDALKETNVAGVFAAGDAELAIGSVTFESQMARWPA